MTTGQQMSMKEIFIQCQSSMQGHAKLLKAMKQLYKQADFVDFWSEFCHYMKYSMIVFKREPAVERTVDFISKFVTSVNPEVSEKEADPDDSQIDEVSRNKLLITVFDFLLQSHCARDKAVRFRCCQMINKLLNNLGDNAQIDDDLYDRIYESMLERLRDKFPVVRLHAVMAVSRLQDPRDENCPVIKAYLFLINADPNPEVRRAVLSCIAPSTKTLPAILQRTRDVKDIVRKMAFSVMGEKVHIKALSIAHRVQLLQDGLNDRTDAVKDTCASKLLQAWLRTFQGNVLDLLTSLDVESATKTCQLTLQTLFKSSPTEELVTKFDLLDETILIPLEKLTCESATYWQTLCKYIYDMGTDGVDDLEKVLPNCVEYCKYTSEFVESLKHCEDLDQQVEKEFILQELLLLIDYMDLADLASRKAVEKLFHDMLIADHVGHTMIKCIVPKLCEIRDSADNVITYIAEMVSEIREPIATIEKGPSADEKRQNDIKIAGIRVKLNQAKDELEECIQNQDFSKAADLKSNISELEAEKMLLLETGESQVEEIRTEKTDVATILKCQTMVTEMLQSLSISSLNPTLQMLAETLILPGIQNEDAGIRTAATKSLGMCCLLNRDLVMQHLPLFMQASQIDVEVVRSAALMVIFDLLHMHGLEAINNEPGETDREEAPSTSDGQSEVGAEPPPSPATTIQQEKDDERVNTASNLVAIISDFLDSESSELRTIAAEGMAKLLLSGRVVSSKIFSHLLLLWYNPVTEDDTHLRHCLGTFFPLFAFACRSNQETVEESFLPTLKTLLNAPLSSPLAEVNEENVAELLVQLTNIRLLLENQNIKENITENPSHANIAVKVCNEILSNPDSFNLKLWVKILNMLEICSGEVSTIKELLVLVDQIIVVIKDKQCLKSAEKFQMILRNILPEMSDNGGDVQEEHTQPATEDEAREETAVVTDKTVLNESAEVDTSSFFQETKVIRRATARSERSMSSLSEKSMIFDTSRSESPRRKWSQSSESSTPEKKIMSPTVMPEIKLPPQKKPTPEKKTSPAKKTTPEKKKVTPGRPVQKDVASTKTSTVSNTPVAGSKKKVTSRTRLSVKSTFTKENTTEASNSTQRTEQEEDLTQEETVSDTPPEDSDKATLHVEKSHEKSDGDIAASEYSTEKTTTAMKPSRTRPKSSKSGSESESPRKSDNVAESNGTIKNKTTKEAVAGKRSMVRSKSSKSGSEGTSPTKSSDRLADKRSVKSPVVTRKTPSRPSSSVSGSASSSPGRSRSSERAANKNFTIGLLTKKTPSRPSSSKSGSESSPQRSKSSERVANKNSTKGLVAKKTPSRPSSSKSGSESSPQRSKSSERVTNKNATKGLVAKKTPSRTSSTKSGSESSSPKRSKSSERAANKNPTKSSVAKKTPGRPNSSVSSLECISPRSKSSDRSTNRNFTKSSISKKTTSRPNSSKSGSESSAPQTSKLSERSVNKTSAKNFVASRKFPSRPISLKSTAQRSRSSERSANKSSTKKSIAKKSTSRPNSSKSASESSLSQRSKSSERTANNSSTKLPVAKKSPRRLNSSKSASESSLSQSSKSSDRPTNKTSTKSSVAAMKTPTKQGTSKSASESSEPEMTKTTGKSNEVKTMRRSKSWSESSPRRSRSLEKLVRRKSTTETPDTAKKTTRSKSGSDSTSEKSSADDTKITKTVDSRTSTRKPRSNNSDSSQSDSPDKSRSSRRSDGDNRSIKTGVEYQSGKRTPARTSKLGKAGSSDTESPAKILSKRNTSKTEKTDGRKSANETPLAGRRTTTRSKLGEKTLSSENKSTEKSVSASASDTQRTSRRSVDADTTKKSESIEKPQKGTTDVIKTPRAEAKATRSSFKSAGKKASSSEKPDDSDLENSVFASPTPVRSLTRSLRTKVTPNTKKDLRESLKKDGTPNTRSSSRRSARR